MKLFASSVTACVECEGKGDWNETQLLLLSARLEVVQVLYFEDTHAISDVECVGKQYAVWIEVVAPVPQFVHGQIDPALWQETV